MEKKIFTFILLIFLSSCGYEAKYSLSKRNIYNFSISKLILIGDRQANLRIKQKLNNYILVQKEKKFVLKISSESERTTTAKDSSGDPTNFKNTLTINVEVLINNEIKNTFKILESFDYLNDSNKSELNKYEYEIKNNLSENVTDELIEKLSKIK
jgi:hypothetical protein